MAASDERSMDTALKRALHYATGPAAGCDPELTAAYAEGRLKGSQRQKLESHLAQCAACRGLATAMLQDKPEAPATSAATWWSWRWAVPAMAGIAIVGSVVYYQRSQVLERPVQHAARVVSTPAAPAANAPVAQPPLADQPVAREGARGARTEYSSALKPRADERVRPAQARIRRAFSRPAMPAPVAAPPLASETVAVAVTDALQSRQAENKKEAAAAPAQQQLLIAGQASGKAAAAPTAYIQSPTLGKQTVPPTPLPEGAPVRHFTQRDQLVWAVSDAGRIFRSTDGGQTWTKLESPTTNDLVRVVWESESSLLVQDKQGTQYRIKP